MTEPGKATNRLTVIRWGIDRLTFHTPMTSGKPPCPRYHHTSVFLREQNLLVICGGRDGVRRGSDYSRKSLALLNLSDMCWIHTKNIGESLRGSYGHAATAYRSQLIVFGGRMADNSLVQTGLAILETGMPFIVTFNPNIFLLLDLEEIKKVLYLNLKEKEYSGYFSQEQKEISSAALKYKKLLEEIDFQRKNLNTKAIDGKPINVRGKLSQSLQNSPLIPKKRSKAKNSHLHVSFVI